MEEIKCQLCKENFKRGEKVRSAGSPMFREKLKVYGRRKGRIFDYEGVVHQKCAAWISKYKDQDPATVTKRHDLKNMEPAMIHHDEEMDVDENVVEEQAEDKNVEDLEMGNAMDVEPEMVDADLVQDNINCEHGDHGGEEIWGSGDKILEKLRLLDLRLRTVEAMLGINPDAFDNGFELDAATLAMQDRVQVVETFANKENEVPDPRALADTTFSATNSQSLSEPVPGTPKQELMGTILISTLPYTEKWCVVCHSKTGRSKIPMSAVIDCLRKQRVLIPPRARICRKHLVPAKLILDHEAYEALEVLPKKDRATLSAEDLSRLFNSLVDWAVCRQGILNFDEVMEESQMKLYTGRNRASFNQMFEIVKPKLPEYRAVSRRNSLGLYLVLLRLGIGQNVLAHLFGVSQSTISRVINGVAAAMDTTFTNMFLGYGHISRKDARNQHQTNFVRDLYKVAENSLVIIADGTYIRVEKPSNMLAQKFLYCHHKHTTLVKTMKIVFPNGHILNADEVWGSDMKNTDDHILLAMMRNESGLPRFLQKGDVIVLDRGFPKAKTELEEQGYRVIMPSFLQRGEKKFTATEADLSRYCTYTRWVVESANGRSKNLFKFFANIVEAKYIPLIKPLYRFTCAFQNAFCPPFLEDKDRHVRVCEEYHSREIRSNRLKQIVESNGLVRKKKIWSSTNSNSSIKLPQLTVNDIEEITKGTYQIKMAKVYTLDKLADDPEYTYQLIDEPKIDGLSTLVQVMLRSRFRGGVTHHVFLEYDLSKAGAQQIEGYYCTCVQGDRTEGCCCHVASTIWYLCYRRHETEELKGFNAAQYVLDAAGRLGLNPYSKENETNNNAEDEESEELEEGLLVRLDLQPPNVASGDLELEIGNSDLTIAAVSLPE